MYYSEDVIDEVKNRADIVDIIGNYVQLKKKGNNYFGLCPFHSEKSASFSVSPEKQMFYCFGCGKGGSVFTFLMEYENFTYPESIEYLAEQEGIELPQKEMTIEEKQRADYRATLREMNRDAANYFYLLLKSDRGQKGYEYLKKRQLSDETILKFGLGFSDLYRDDLYNYLKKKGYKDDVLKDSGLVEIDTKGVMDKFWNRVMFPILDLNGKVIGFGGRVMGDGKPKYLNSKETALFEKKKNLYGFYQARKSKRDGLILCEGYMDVISMHQAGFDNSSASLGTAFTQEQASLIKRYFDHVYLAYDSDGAGQKAALRAISICREAKLPARVINMKPYKDPDEFMKALGSEEFEKRISESVSGIMFEIYVLAQNYNLKDPQDKAQFARQAEERLALIPDKIEREAYVEATAREYGYDYKGLLSNINSLGERNIERQKYKEVLEQDKKSINIEKQKREEKHILQEKMLLTWIVNDLRTYKAISSYIQASDFSPGLTREIAQIIEKQMQENGKINPSRIIDSYTDVSKHSAISAILNAEVHYSGENDGDENLKLEYANIAITEIVKRVKEASIARQLKELAESSLPSDQKNSQYMALIKQQANVKKLYISLDNG